MWSLLLASVVVEECLEQQIGPQAVRRCCMDSLPRIVPTVGNKEENEVAILSAGDWDTQQSECEESDSRCGKLAVFDRRCRKIQLERGMDAGSNCDR